MCSSTDLSCLKKKMALLDYVKSIWIQSEKSKWEGHSETIWSTLLHLLLRKLGPRDGEQLAQGHSGSCGQAGDQNRWPQFPILRVLPYSTPPLPDFPSLVRVLDLELGGWLGSTPGNMSDTNSVQTFPRSPVLPCAGDTKIKASLLQGTHRIRMSLLSSTMT